jgi:poly(hydroxyalkanoate) granule-associated protein
MATRKNTRRQAATPARRIDAGSLWLAGVGAVSLARQQGASLLGELIGEGRRLQQQAARFVREARGDVESQIGGLVKPVKARLGKGLKKAGNAVQARIAGGLSALGIPSKADIDELSQRVGALSRQLKAGK